MASNQIIKQTFRTILTDKGPYTYVVLYIDRDIVVGGPAGHTGYILIPQSVIASENVLTEFTSLDGSLSCKQVGDEIHTTFKTESWGVITEPKAAVKSGRCYTSAIVLIGTNNVPCMFGFLHNNNTSSDTPGFHYTKNTKNEFGLWVYPNFSTAAASTANQKSIDVGREFLEISVPVPVNPYDPVGPSEPGGGGGTFDDTSDQIPDSTNPSLSSANTGFTRIYNPTLSQVQSLAQYLWTDTSVIDTIWNHIKQYFEDPMQAIIGFNLVPVPVPDGGTQEFKLMYIGTGVNMTVAASQFVDVDCGTYTVEKYYGSALDYSPYTKISCFLPFIGNVDLNPDEVMGATLQITYRVDICSGSCVAKILVDGNCLYQYSGHCAIPIPLASADFSSYVSAAVSVAKLAIGAAVAGAAGAAAGAAMEAGQATGQIVETTQIVNTARNPQSGRQITTGTQTVTVSRPQPEPRNQTQASFAGLSPANVANTVGEVMSSKPIFQHSGSFSGNTGYLGVRRPYLIITRPNLCMPANFQKLNGYPCMMTLKLGDCTGYTRVQQVQLTGLWATNPEQAEILQLLKSGVIL